MSPSFKNLLLSVFIIILAVAFGVWLNFLISHKRETKQVPESRYELLPQKSEISPKTNIKTSVEVSSVLRETSPFHTLAFPTKRQLKREESEHFQPTASGKAESAYYGSVRTVNAGKHLVASFHEGIDIAPLTRNNKGMPEDEIYAIAEGKIAYINKIAGNSNYGKYVIVAHPTSKGEVFSLYAHLASIDGRIREGMPIKAGEVLGIMGNTASTGVQKQLAHLHLEIGLMLNSAFGKWYAAQKLKPYHGNYHGWNFIGIDPLLVYEQFEKNPEFDFFELVRSLPVAFVLSVKCSTLPDYFKRYAIFWNDAKRFDGKGIAMAVSEAGLPISGRNITEDELKMLGKQKWYILKVYPDVLGRNGARLIIQRGGKWILSEDGNQWLTILTYN